MQRKMLQPYVRSNGHPGLGSKGTYKRKHPPPSLLPDPAERSCVSPYLEHLTKSNLMLKTETDFDGGCVLPKGRFDDYETRPANPILHCSSEFESHLGAYRCSFTKLQAADSAVPDAVPEEQGLVLACGTQEYL